jgi:ribonuclease E/ribonuclease G
MNDRTIFVESNDRGLRAALTIDRRLAAIEIDWLSRPTKVGAIGPAKVIRIVRNLGPIVRLWDGAEMLLSRDRGPAFETGARMLVQVQRDQRGAKLGVASGEIALAGRGLVHLPRGANVSLSRRLDLADARRAALTEMLGARAGGWIIRRTARAMTEFELAREAVALEDAGRSLDLSQPAVPPPDAFRRLITDHGAPAPGRMLVSGRVAERSVALWLERFAPDLAGRLDLHADRSNLFDAHDLDAAVADLGDPRVPLGDGGSLVIERTEALTAIDVNAGAATNVLAANLGAAQEIGRQLVLRHLGGIIVIDFVSMGRAADGERVVAALASAVADDPARTDILPMSAFGLVEMTRERRGPELELGL